VGGSGFWLLNGIHTVAQMRYILGEAKCVYLQEHKTGSFKRDDVEGTMSGSITLESGVNVMLTQTAETRMHAGYGKYMLYGDNGMLNALPDKALFHSKDLKKGGYPEVLVYPAEGLSSYAQELEAFVHYVENGIEGPTTGVSERRSLAIVQAGYESAETGKAINLHERFGRL
jgi:predicted dehydrogenase